MNFDQISLNLHICKKTTTKKQIDKITKVTEKPVIYVKLEKKVCPALDNYGQSCFVRNDLYAPTTKSWGHINLPLSVRPSRYRYMVCPAISSYSFRATALIFCRMFIHIMEVCMSTGF